MPTYPSSIRFTIFVFFLRTPSYEIRCTLYVRNEYIYLVISSCYGSIFSRAFSFTHSFSLSFFLGTCFTRIASHKMPYKIIDHNYKEMKRERERASVELNSAMNIHLISSFICMQSLKPRFDSFLRRRFQVEPEKTNTFDKWSVVHSSTPW